MQFKLQFQTVRILLWLGDGGDTKYNTLIRDTKYNTLIGDTKYNTLPSYKVQYSVQPKEPKPMSACNMHWSYKRIILFFILQLDMYTYKPRHVHTYCMRRSKIIQLPALCSLSV